MLRDLGRRHQADVAFELGSGPVLQVDALRRGVDLRRKDALLRRTGAVKVQPGDPAQGLQSQAEAPKAGEELHKAEGREGRRAPPLKLFAGIGIGP